MILPDADVAAPDDLRSLSQSPHPYRNGSVHHRTRTSSDSGTEADDESTGLLKGLPAPPLRSRRGARPNGDHDLWLPGLQRWPSMARSTSRSSRRSSIGDNEAELAEMRNKMKKKKHIEVIRRSFEAALLLSVGGVVLGQQSVRSLAWAWKKGTMSHFLEFIVTIANSWFVFARTHHLFPYCRRCLRDIPSKPAWTSTTLKVLVLRYPT